MEWSWEKNFIAFTVSKREYELSNNFKFHLNC